MVTGDGCGREEEKGEGDGDEQTEASLYQGQRTDTPCGQETGSIKVCTHRMIMEQGGGGYVVLSPW